MKIRELMEALSHLNPELEIRIPDTFWQNEGWGEATEDFDRLNPIVYTFTVDEENGCIILNDRDLVEDEWEDCIGDLEMGFDPYEGGYTYDC